MTNSIGNNKIYQTFSPFITPKTTTAEKNINGKEFVVRKPPPNISKEFYKFLATTSFLLIPMLSIGLSRKSIKSMVKQSNLDYFRIAYSEPDSWRTNLYLKIEKSKNYIGKKLLSFLPSVTTSKDKITSHLNNSVNNEFEAVGFRKINNIFKGVKKLAAAREYQKVLKSYSEMEKLVNQQLELIEQSSNNGLKILFSKDLLKNTASEIPVAIDISKTATGKNRADEIKKILAEIKKQIIESKYQYPKIRSKITYSCDDIFFEAENTLKNIAIKLNSSNLSSKSDALIKQIYETLTQYRFAEILPEHVGMNSTQIRKAHINKVLMLINELENTTNHRASLEIHNLKHLLRTKTDATFMGAVEQLRALLKCNDIHPEILQEHVSPSILKQYRTEDYIKTKKSINHFAEKFQFATNTQSKYLDKRLTEIDRGRVFPQLLSIIIPSCILSMGNDYNIEKKNRNKSILFSFLAGAGTMIISRYTTMWKKTSSVLCGLFAALLAPHIYNKFFEKNKKSS